jgi:hypothetical protein
MTLLSVSKSFCAVSAYLDTQLHSRRDFFPFLNFTFVDMRFQLVVLVYQMRVAGGGQHLQQSISWPWPFYPHNVF